nr:hypothetical protein [Tanacetum cinerariifolium]
MLNHDSSIISSSSKIDSLLDEFAGEPTLLKSISPGIDKTDCHPKNEIRLSQRLLYDNSSPRPPEEFNSKNSNAKIESFSPSPIPNKDSDSFMEETDLFLNPDDPIPPSIEDDEDSEGDIFFLERLLHDDPIPLQDTLDFSYEVSIFLPFFTYPVTSPILLSLGNEDTIFDPGITINHFYSFKPGLSHRHGAFKKFNTHRSHLNEWPIIINGKNTPILDVLLLEVSEIVIPEEEEIEDDNLREKLLNVHLLIPNIEALKDNPAPGSTTTHSDISLPDYEAFSFDDHIEKISSLFSIPGNLKTLAKGFYPLSLHFLSFNWES